MSLNGIKSCGTKGFTLIEVLVSVSIFAVVMLVATGSVFAIVQANKKTHTLKSVMTNLNFALESMARDIRVGKGYVCDGLGDCESGGTIFRYKANRDVDEDGSYVPADAFDQIEYKLVGARVQKSVYASTGLEDSYITAEEISVESIKFYLTGSAALDDAQPKVVITITGHAGAGPTRTDFNIETTLSQRAIDS